MELYHLRDREYLEYHGVSNNNVIMNVIDFYDISSRVWQGNFCNECLLITKSELEKLQKVEPEEIRIDYLQDCTGVVSNKSVKTKYSAVHYNVMAGLQLEAM